MITGMAPVSAISRTMRRIGGMLRSTLRLSMGALPKSTAVSSLRHCTIVSMLPTLRRMARSAVGPSPAPRNPTPMSTGVSVVTRGRVWCTGPGPSKRKSPEDETAPGLLSQRLAAPEGSVQ